MSGFTKLFESITDSTIWRAPDTTRLVWITMLAMADQNGYVAAAVPGLADRARVSLEACLAALATFQEPDEWSRTKDNEGRRIEEVDGGWRLLNYAKYRAIRAQDERREYMRNLMATKRALAPLLAPVSHVSPSYPIAEAEAEAEAKTKQKKEPARGSRLPQDWKPSAELQAWAKTERPDLNIRREFDAFTDYWRAVPGARGVKLDWPATFRNWIRKANGAGREPGGPPVGKPVNTSGPSPKLPDAELKAREREALALQKQQLKEFGMGP